jgi:hypothetical protein
MVNLDVSASIQSLSFGTGNSFTGTLNLLTNKLVIQSADSADMAAKLSALAAAIRSGINGGIWTGPGITSASAVANPRSYGVGLFDNRFLGLTTFGGMTTDVNSLLLSLAHVGDANINGLVDIQDLTIVANNWQKPSNNWASGDLNLDGITDIQDFTIVANNWQQSSSFSIYNSSFSISQPLPEPATLSLLLLPLFLLPRRHRL